MTDLTPKTYEEAMSSLTAAIGVLDRNWPQTACQASRLAEQVGRLDRICAKATSAINKMPAVPTDDEIVATAPHVLSPYSNIARGTIGHAIMRLKAEGRLREREVRGILYGDTRYIYEAVK